MGRLIDADVFEEFIRNKYADGEKTEDVKEQMLFDLSYQPTAYDLDKVVVQLEDEVKEYDKRIERRNGDCYFDETEKIKALEERARGIERAIEIVKGGGVNG